MPVNHTHPEYLAFAPDWSRARDVLAGEDAVKAAGERYLPRIESQNDSEYVAYRQRASFFNATARTAEGYVGLIFRRPPFVKSPEAKTKGTEQGRGGTRPYQTSGVARALARFLEDADLLGTSLAGYAKSLVTEIIGVGRAGSLVDWENDFEQRAFVSLYSAEQIINWRVERVNGRTIPTLIVLSETARRRVNGSTADDFVDDTVEQIRVLKLVEPGREAFHRLPLSSPSVGKDAFHRVPLISPSSAKDKPRAEGGNVGDAVERVPPGGRELACVVELWQPKPRGRNQSQTTKPQTPATEWHLVETRVPLRLGKPLPLIPFVFHGPRHSRPEVDKLPLNDIIAVNLDHYRLDADYKHGLHFTALPTAWVSGFDKSTNLRIGSSTAWIAEVPGATAGFLEFTGQGLTSFERAMDRDERLMAVLGSRLLEDQKKVGETAQAIELRQSGENSVLSSIAASASESLTQVLRWIYWWNSTEDAPDAVTDNQVLVKLNTDFSLQGMTSQELQAVVNAWQANAISRDTMLELFRRGEILPDGRTNEDERAMLARDQPANPRQK
jgi:hypothetical protein